MEKSQNFSSTEAGRVSTTSWMFTGCLKNKKKTKKQKNIFDVYRLGRLHLNSSGLCAIRMKALIDYWHIDELLLGRIIFSLGTSFCMSLS